MDAATGTFTTRGTSGTCKLAQHPGGSRFYGVSQWDLDRIDVSAGTIQAVIGSRYFDEYPICGVPRLFGGGSRLMTNCAATFRLSDVPADDIQYGGSFTLPNAYFADAVEIPGRPRIAAVLTDSGRPAVTKTDRIFRFRTDNLDADGESPLPCVDADRKAAAHGTHVFARSDGSAVYVVLEPNPNQGVVGNAAIARMDP